MPTENNDYASKGVAGAGLGLGIAGTALGVLGNGLGNLLGRNSCGCNNGMNGWNGYDGGVNGYHGNGYNGFRHDHALLAISERDARIAKLESEKYSDGKTQELYNYTVSQNEKLAQFLCNVDKRVTALEVSAPLREQILDGKIAQVTDKMCCCCNATNAALANLSTAVGNITKLVVPLGAVCPQPMPQFNSWTAPTAVAPTSVVVTPTATPAAA